jgi:predicted transcriptional regulator
MATGDFALTVPQMRQAAQMYGEGRSQRAIAQALGASRTAVRSALRHHGVSPRPQKEAAADHNKSKRGFYRKSQPVYFQLGAQ